MARILITGGTGFIGSHLVDELLTLGYEVRVFSRNGKKGSLPNNLSWFCGDLLNLNDLEEASKDVDGIVHLAAVSRVFYGFKEPLKCMNVNVIGTMNVLESARNNKNKSWVILGSSSQVLWAQKDKMKSFSNIKNIYSISKLVNELCGERYAKDYGQRVMSLRFSSVYGSTRDNQDNVLPKLILRSLNNEDLIINGKDTMLNFIYFKDVIDGIIAGIKRIERVKEPYFGKFNLASDNYISLGQLAELIIKKADSNSKIIFQEPEEIQNEAPTVDCSDAKNILNFKPKIDIKDGIYKTIKCMKENRLKKNKIEKMNSS